MSPLHASPAAPPGPWHPAAGRAPVEAPLPRADEPGSGVLAASSAEAPAGRGIFPFAAPAPLSLATGCLLAYLFLAASAIDEEWPAIGDLHPRLALGAVALLAAVFGLLSRRGEVGTAPRVGRAPAALLLLFLAAVALSASDAYDPVRAWAAAEKQAVAVVGFFLVTGLCRTRRDVVRAAAAVVAGAGFYLLRSASEYAAGRHQVAMGVKRMLGAGTSTNDPNSFAATVVLAFPLVLWAARASRSRALRLCALGYGLLGAVCVFLTHSRSGLVLLVLAALWATASVSGRLARAGVLVALVALAVPLIGGLTPTEAKRFAGLATVDTLTTDESAHGRIEGYEVSWRIFGEHPLLGVGPGCWAAYRQNRVDGNAHEAHTLVGQLLGTLGALGTLAFLGYVVASARTAWRLRRERTGALDAYGRALRALAGAVLVTLLMLFVSGLAAHNVERTTWFLLPALLVALARAPADAFPAGTRS